MDNQPTDPTPPAATVPLKRPPLWSNRLTFMTTVACAFAVNAAIEVVPEIYRGVPFAEMYRALAGLIFWLALVFGVLGKRLIVRMSPLKAIAFLDDGVVLPRGAESLGHTKVPYTEIMAVNEGGYAPRRHFFIESRRRVFHLPQEIFRDADGPERLLLELRRRIMSLPQGATLIEHTEKRRLSALQAMTIKPYATQAMLGVMTVLFLNTELKGALDSSLGLVRWGANAPLLVHHGEYFRLLAANFLHSGFLHIGMNALAVYYLGTLLERLLGPARFLLIYLTTGLAAMAASAYFEVALMTVGASGAVFGLLGAFAVVSWRLKEHLPLGLRQPLGWWVFIIGINALLPFLWPVVDVVAHLAGFVTGVVVCAVLLGVRKTLPAPPGKLTTGAAVAMVALYVAGLAAAVQYAATTPGAVEERFARTLLHDSRTSPDTLNNLAWTLAIDPRSTDEALAAASTVVEHAVQQAPNEGAYHDTAALVAYRLKDFDAAIAAERRALSLDPDNAFFYSQLAPLLAARTAKDGPILPPGMPKDSVALHYTASDRELRLDIADPTRFAKGGTVYAVLSHGKNHVGLVHIVLGAQPQTPLIYLAKDVFLPRKVELEAQLALVEAAPTETSPGEAEWQVWPVVTLPQ